MPAPEIILDLIERFERNRGAYHSAQYNETQLRLEFLNPFFESLGWDVSNRQGYAEAYKDVIHEDAIRVGEAVKAPDYAFRIGGTRKFFVEAKKPSINLKDDLSPAYQLRRYAWSARLPLSILTDFEEFAVYDCQGKPDKSDKASTGRVMYFDYRHYPERWDEVAAIFQRDAILKGSFDRYAAAARSKHGIAEVDDAFLAEIERWRELLARNLALRNPGLTQRELNYAVQMTIDRVLFLRIGEDRGAEFYGGLMALLNGDQVYDRLRQLFRRADERYNSGLFHFREEKGAGHGEAPDTLTPALSIDDKPLKDILRNLYYPDSPYVFSQIPADILGQVYERFLGKVIRLTAGHHAVVEEKPEVKKAGGVYYTPTYIVEYIVRQALGSLLEGKQPGDKGLGGKGDPLRILDPACGSGSFLLGAYQYLLDWYRDGYVAAGAEKYAKGRRPALYQAAGGEWRLTTAERKRILLDHIYGVDIDPQAVEVTKLSLLLKVLEGENEQTINTQLSFFQERVLPDLADNIQCGNSLIGPDFYAGAQMALFDAEERYRVNAFDWAAAFPPAFAAGGFDAVIGNPPYIRIHNLVDYYPEEVKFIQSTFSAASFGKVDIYVAFVERGFQLLRNTGKLGFIVPNKFMQADYGVGLRKLLVQKRAITQLVDFGNAQVFENATTYTCLLFLSGSAQEKFQAKFNRMDQPPKSFLSDTSFEVRDIRTFGTSIWQTASSTETIILDKLQNNNAQLSDIVELAITGVKTGANSVFVFELLHRDEKVAFLRPEDTNAEVELEIDFLLSYLKAESLKRYHIAEGTRLLLYPYTLIDGQMRLVSVNQLHNCPKTWKYLIEHRRILEGRQKGKLEGPGWYGLSFASSLKMFTVPKIVTPTLAPRNSFSLDSSSYLFPQGAGGGCGLVPKSHHSPYYLLGLLNSKLLTFYFQRNSSVFQGGWFAYEPRYLKKIPICLMNPTNPEDAQRHARMVSLVESMLTLHRQLAAARTPQEKTALQRQVETTDRQIDALVYELYGLSDEEIAIVEGRAE